MANQHISVFAAVVCACVLLTAACTSAVTPPHIVFAPSDTAHTGGVNSTAPLAVNTTTFPNLAGDDRNGYLGVFTHAAPYFSVQSADSACTGLATVSKQASAHDCTYATNGGPFKSLISGGCIGAVIVDGVTVASDYTAAGDMFGLTAAGDWVLGTVSNASQAAQLGLTQLVTGFGWLVYDGQAVVTTAGGEQAPRTAVGVDGQGRLVLLEVDGCEKCKTGKGFTLKQLADFLASGAAGDVRHAINLDGGGSSTFVQKGVVVDYPTCIDVHLRCERSVSTIMCVR